jgi:tetratricopeptide (TPR) repeat protein
MRDWTLIYLDPIAAVFVYNSSQNAPLIEAQRIDISRDTIEPVALNDTLNDAGLLPLGKMSDGSRSLSDDVAAQNYFNLGLVFYMTGRMDRAVQQLEAGLELMPDSAEGHYNIGLAYDGMNRAEDAARYYERAIGINPRHAGAHTNLGTIYYMRGLKDRAEREYKLAVKGDGKKSIALFYLGVLSHERGDLKSARTYWEKALKENPSLPQAKQALEELP